MACASVENWPAPVGAAEQEEEDTPACGGNWTPSAPGAGVTRAGGAARREIAAASDERLLKSAGDRIGAAYGTVSLKTAPAPLEAVPRSKDGATVRP